MMITGLGLGTVAGTTEDGVTEVLSNINFPAVVLLATSGIVGLVFIVRWMIHYQKEFTNFYVEENNKLRARQDDLEEEVRAKDAVISGMGREIIELERKIGRQELTIQAHEERIDRLKSRLGENGDDVTGHSDERQ